MTGGLAAAAAPTKRRRGVCFGARGVASLRLVKMGSSAPPNRGRNRLDTAGSASQETLEVATARSYLPWLLGRGDETFGSLFRDVEKLFEAFSRRPPFTFGADAGALAGPKIDVAETKDAMDVTAELPGIEDNDIDLTLANGLLTIRGEKNSERNEQHANKNSHVIERSYGCFSRSIALPFEPVSDKVEVKFDNGVVRLHLPKPPAVAGKQRKIEIKKR
jgi:HSP20 family protein